MKWRVNRCWAALSIVLCLFAASGLAQEAKEPAEFVPEHGVFPPTNAGHHFAGELVAIDGINRRGGLRLDGDFIDDRYDKASLHMFAMLPYGEIWYHGAPAELRDIPLGTHLHGSFVLPPAGDKTIPKPEGHGAKYVPKYNHVIRLEDDFSFYSRQGQSWKIVAADLENGKLKVVSTGETVSDGLAGEVVFDIDRSTRVWQGRAAAELEAIAPDQIVQVNTTWAPDWRNKKFHCADIWIDEESRQLAAEQQRRIHVRFQHYHWLAGIVDNVEQLQNGRGIVTINLFSGMAPSLYEEFTSKPNQGASVAVAEFTLRTWWQDHDSKSGRIVEINKLENPPPGHSGLQVRVEFGELLEGYRPSRYVRIRLNNWPNVKLPPEERIREIQER